MYIHVLGFKVFAAGRNGLRRQLEDRMLSRCERTAVVATINPHSVVTSRTNSRFLEALQAADFLIPDGVGIALVGRAAGANLEERVTGSDAFEIVMDLANVHRLRVALVGGASQTLDRFVAQCRARFPQASIVYWNSPPFEEVISAATCDRIAEELCSRRIDVTLVGLGAPKQEIFASELRRLTRRQVIVSVGAVFDFVAGTVARPGHVMQSLGLEWLGRLCREPARLWRRTFISGPKFLWMSALWIVKSWVRPNE